MRITHQQYAKQSGMNDVRQIFYCMISIYLYDNPEDFGSSELWLEEFDKDGNFIREIRFENPFKLPKDKFYTLVLELDV